MSKKILSEKFFRTCNNYDCFWTFWEGLFFNYWHKGYVWLKIKKNTRAVQRRTGSCHWTLFIGILHPRSLCDILRALFQALENNLPLERQSIRKIWIDCLTVQSLYYPCSFIIMSGVAYISRWVLKGPIYLLPKGQRASLLPRWRRCV